MSNILINQLNKWYISYNPYTDVFQMYGDESLCTNKSRFKKIKLKTGYMYADKQTNKPLLIEFIDAYKNIGDIDNMTKDDIIQRVMGYVTNHG